MWIFIHLMLAHPHFLKFFLLFSLCTFCHPVFRLLSHSSVSAKLQLIPSGMFFISVTVSSNLVLLYTFSLLKESLSSSVLSRLLSISIIITFNSWLAYCLSLFNLAFFLRFFFFFSPYFFFWNRFL